MDRTDAMVFQHLFRPVIRKAIQKGVKNCDSCQRNKKFNTKYGKVPTKLVDETQRNKLCVYLIGPYNICIKGEYLLILKVVTIVYRATGWFEVREYDNKKVITITNLVMTAWLSR